MGGQVECYGITPAMRFASGARAGGDGELHCGFLSEPGRKKEKRETLGLVLVCSFGFASC